MEQLGRRAGQQAQSMALWLCGSTTTVWRAPKRWGRGSLCFSQSSGTATMGLCLDSKLSSACFLPFKMRLFEVPESQCSSLFRRARSKSKSRKRFLILLKQMSGIQKDSQTFPAGPLSIKYFSGTVIKISGLIICEIRWLKSGLFLLQLSWTRQGTPEAKGPSSSKFWGRQFATRCSKWE